MYPLCMVIFWGPNMFLFPLYNAQLVSAMVFELSLLMGTLNGAAVGFIFFLRSNEAKNMWYKLLFRRPSNNNLFDNKIQLSSTRTDSGGANLMSSTFLSSNANPNQETIVNGAEENLTIYEYMDY